MGVYMANDSSLMVTDKESPNTSVATIISTNAARCVKLFVYFNYNHHCVRNDNV